VSLGTGKTIGATIFLALGGFILSKLSNSVIGTLSSRLLNLSNITAEICEILLTSNGLKNLKDHKQIGIEQELFFTNEISPPAAFWLPNGMINL